MKYISEYRDNQQVNGYIKAISAICTREYTIMEVCGGHTMAIHRFGIPGLLPNEIKLVSGPGCPVCVTDRSFIDKAIELTQNQDNLICTFGDLIRVPGSFSSLEKQKAEYDNVRIVYSILEALDLAVKNDSKNVIFLAIGFETTAPSTAVAILKACELRLNNFFILSAHKVMPPAMKAIVDFGVKIDGYLCPGHVSTITGSKIFNFIPEVYKLGCVVSGFEPLDILQSIYLLVAQLENNEPKVEIQYKRAVTVDGNVKAQKIMESVFKPGDDYWRGLGIIPLSGLKIKEKFDFLNAEKKFSFSYKSLPEKPGCICGEILKGTKTPLDCNLFNKVCTPENPIGACMVSGEGACQAFYKFNRINNSL
jgi:hydrogenase expression/formation protein HypD